MRKDILLWKKERRFGVSLFLLHSIIIITIIIIIIIIIVVLGKKEATNESSVYYANGLDHTHKKTGEAE